jgi:tetratricopeptide (TPR) repeat protein
MTMRASRAVRTWCAVPAIVAGLLASAPVIAQEKPKPAAAKPAKTATKPPAGSATANKKFEALAARANAAREAEKLEEAAPLYEQALALNPAWAEGYWYLGTINYTLDRFEPARDAFRRVTRLMADNAEGWLFLGLCDFHLRSYEDALSSLLRANTLGLHHNAELAGVARYHSAILLSRVEDYEQALTILRDFAQEGNDGPRVIEAFGIATLRIPMLPGDVPGSRREAVMLAGRASYYTAARQQSAAEKAYQELVFRYPEMPHVHYAYGVFLVMEKPDQAIEEFKKELEISQRHPWARMQIAFEYIKRAEWELARPYAEQAVAEAPNAFVARRALGQVLLETGDVEGAVREYEIGVKLAPESPSMRFALARAYRRAGRTADAEREQAEFARLDRQFRAQRLGPQSIGGIEMEASPADGSASTPQ